MQAAPTPAGEPAGPDGDAASVDTAVELARRLLTAGADDEHRRERRRRERLGRLITDEAGRALLFALTDEVLRIDDETRAARRFADIVAAYDGTALGLVDRALLRTGGVLGPRAPALVMPLIRRRVASETSGIVLPAEDRPLTKHYGKRHRDGVGLIVNPLGEAVLSDRDAADGLRRLLAQIARDDVDYVSVKISSLVANLDVLAFDHSVDRVVESLRVVYRAARSASVTTFVNLDMEEYRDLELTLASFMRVLDEPEFVPIDAGIVLQAYLPDSHAALERVGEWAARRHEAAGGVIKVRLVKGANLAMELVEAEQHGWSAAPYGSKADVDASYKAMLERALNGPWGAALRVGVASHNLFDLAWALVSARDTDLRERIDFEMLEGMAPSHARALQDTLQGTAHDLLMYAPVVARDDFDASIAYLARRLDENSQPDNFLRALFSLRPDTPDWHEQERRFRRAVDERRGVSTSRRRRPLPRVGRFSNEPDSDFTDPNVRRDALGAEAPPVAVDPITSTDGIDEVIDRAARAFQSWSALTSHERRVAIGRVADVMRGDRFTTIATMAATTGKTIEEGDPEVGEAIDFAEYYSGLGRDVVDDLRHSGVGLHVAARGVVAVLGPWNFPYAIPAGGVFAALSAGNAVVLKPAPEAVEVSAVLVDQIHRAGVDPDLVQLVVCEDGPVGRHLVTHDRVDTVVLTGSSETAELFLGWKPDLRLFAETSGKNSMIITATADLDLAIDDLVSSAFGHAGQKCSAASIGIIEATLYDDPDFHERLREVVLSRRVGWPDDPATIIGPIIGPPAGKLERALTELDRGERWLVEPEQLDESGRLWRPGVRVDVQPGSWFHRTECFGPVLGLIRAIDLDHAIAVQNDTDYGLTGGIHSLDPAEIDQWIERVQVGNAYVNRHVTGAVVQRQPFGGWKKSSVGPGSKAGGPNYVLQFTRLDEVRPADPDVVDGSYAAAWRTHFSVEHDPAGLTSESNVLRYRPVPRVVVRHDGSSPEAIRRFRRAAALTQVVLVVSNRADVDDEDFLAGLRCDDRVRLIGDTSSVRQALNERSIWYDVEPPSPSGRVELLKWMREQAISRTTHRHGRVETSG